ncbi:MAG TPA: hypothetical protein ENJ08_00550 [Gammaproteobacteria bacterium]|nr:hypothetical protein [Gammaproteobacteria bacterium]
MKHMNGQEDPLYRLSSHHLELLESLSDEQKINIYMLALSNKRLLLLYAINLFSYIIPPVLVIINLMAVVVTFQTSRLLYGNLAGLIIAPFAFLPVIGLIVVAATGSKASKKLLKYGFKVTMDSDSLVPVHEWIEKSLP